MSSLRDRGKFECTLEKKRELLSVAPATYETCHDLYLKEGIGLYLVRIDVANMTLLPS
jgi:hypothetical protein